VGGVPISFSTQHGKDSEMFTVSIKIGACYMAHAEDSCKETAVAKSVELSRKIVNWKEGATPRFTIIYPNGKQYGRNVAV